MRHSTGKPTLAEASRIEAMMKLGCVACATIAIPAPAIECHHILRGNKRLGHEYTIPLCLGHHKGEWSPEQKEVMRPEWRVAISDGRKRFTAIYPTERQLWNLIQERLHLPAIWPQSKILPRREMSG